MALGGYYLYVKDPSVKKQVDRWIGIEGGARGTASAGKSAKPDDPAKRGILPAGYYVAEVVPGVAKDPAASGTSEWVAPGLEDGQRWVVVGLSVVC